MNNIKINWVKLIENEPDTWPEGNKEILVKVSKPGFRSNVFLTGRLSVYKTVRPKFRAHFSRRCDEYNMSDINCWTYLDE